MTNNAERLTLEEKLDLVKSRARIMGFRRHDLEDAVQEVMLSPSALNSFSLRIARIRGYF